MVRYRRCRHCGRPDSEALLSARGSCADCSRTRLVESFEATIATVHALRRGVCPGQLSFDDVAEAAPPPKRRRRAG